MKYYALCLIFIGSLLLGCDKNEDLSTEEIINPPPTEISTIEVSPRGYVTDPYSLFSAHLNYLRIHNARVELMFAGEALLEVNTDEDGFYEFPEVEVPANGTFLRITAPGYYPNVVVIDAESPTISYPYLFRSTFGNFAGEGLSNAERYVRIYGFLQEPTNTGGATFYLTNAENELVGNYTSDGDLRFDISTVADQPLFLHYEFQCLRGGPIPIGSLSQSLNLGTVFDLSVDFLEDLVTGEINATDCGGGSVSSGYGMITRNGQTIYRQETDFYYAEQCLLEDDPSAFLTFITTDPRRYGTVNINYSGGAELDLSVEVCTVDDTYLRYAIDDGPEQDLQLFTFMNELPDGRAILKQINPSIFDPGCLSVELLGSTPGATSGDVRAYTQGEIDFGGNGLTMTVLSNDGDFVEGTFSGPIFDTNEELIGNMEGSFRAKIQ